MDYIYGIISQKAKDIDYYGIESDTANTTIQDKYIHVDVKRSIPLWTEEDIGKVLMVGLDGKLKWEFPTLLL